MEQHLNQENPTVVSLLLPWESSLCPHAVRTRDPELLEGKGCGFINSEFPTGPRAGAPSGSSGAGIPRARLLGLTLFHLSVVCVTLGELPDLSEWDRPAQPVVKTG